MHKLSLLKAVIFISVAAVATLSAYTIFFFSPFFTQLIIKNAQTEALRIATRFSELMISDQTAGDRSILDLKWDPGKKLPNKWVAEIKKAEKDFALMKVKIFLSTGKILYSTDSKDIGQTNQRPYFKEMVAKGRTYTRVILKNTRSLEDQIVTANVVEAYVPVMRSDRFLGAFEVYYDITPIKGKLGRLVMRSHIMSLFLALGLMAAVTLLSLKAIKRIKAQVKDQNEELSQAHKRLLTVLDGLDAAVYVSEMDTYQILFANRYVREAYGDVEGKICWQVLQNNRSGPCEHCLRDRLLNADGEPAGVQTREFQQKTTGKWYEAHNRAIRWVDDRIVKLEIATDITERKLIEMELRQAHLEMSTFCRIVKQISTERTLEGVGAFLMKEVKQILDTDCMQLFVFSTDRSAIFVLSQKGADIIREPEVILTVSAIIEGLKGVNIAPQKIFNPPLIPDSFPANGRQTIIPLQIQNYNDGAFVVVCPPDSLCDETRLDLVALILEQVSGAIRRAVVHEEEIRSLQIRLEQTPEFIGMIGKDAKMRMIYKLIEDIAPSDATVLIQGESGTGKELVARAIYRKSLRHDRPFVVINCSAYPATLLESELFGHEKGAFTGAIRQKPGRFEKAHGGTVFLDEIAEIPPSAQIKLLRVLQTQKFERLGGEKTLTVDMRILAATNKDLILEVQEGRFREDLYYRLHVIPVVMPPLRNRPNDIPLLSRYFQQRFAKELNQDARDFTSEAMRLLLNYPWPGNVRELENSIEHAVVLSKGGRIDVLHLPVALRDANPRHLIKSPGTISENERILLKEVLEEYNWNKRKAALHLGISRSTLYGKLRKYQIRRSVH